MYCFCVDLSRRSCLFKN
uniref:Uncharacterized protein n=1 Tax=Arundo donax TaxID=35708 RepID=A0A0A9FX20_ARUDO